MTIRVNKQPFNIREKLSELERPIGVKGSELIKSETVYQARNALSADRKNLVINGNMAIDQRNDGSSFTATDHYVLDRYKLKENTSGSFSINRDAFPVGDQHPEGHRYAMQVACSGADTSLSGNEHGVIFQMIEGFNTIGTGFGTKAAKNMTLSFWVKTNVPGTYSIALQNGAQNRCQVKEYQAGMSGMVWEKISVTFSGCNDGSWVVSTATGMKITWGLAGAQSSYATTDIDAWKSSNLFLSADQVNFFSSTNNRFFLTGVQLEIGDQATEFEHRSYGEELALCQRYFYINGGEEHDIISQAFSPATTEIAIAWPHPTEMRAVPTVTISSTNNNNTDFYFRTINNTGFSLTGNGRSLSQMTKHHASIWFNGMSGVPAVPGQVRVQNDRTAFIHLSAEL